MIDLRKKYKLTAKEHDEVLKKWRTGEYQEVGTYYLRFELVNSVVIVARADLPAPDEGSD